MVKVKYWTVPVGGPTGIPTDPSHHLKSSKITVDRIFTDNFNGWSVGQLQVLISLMIYSMV